MEERARLFGGVDSLRVSWTIVLRWISIMTISTSM